MSFQEEVVALLVKKAAELFGLDPASLNAETRFKEDLGCKSADIVKFTVALEDEYDVEVPFMAFNRNATFGEAAAYMSDLTGIE